MFVRAVYTERTDMEKARTDALYLSLIHIYLSAVTLSQNEFFAMDDSFTKDDFGAFVTAVYHHHTRKDQEDSSELRTYGKKYYLEEISDYLGQTRTKLYCSNLNQLLFHNNGYSGKFLCDPAAVSYTHLSDADMGELFEFFNAFQLMRNIEYLSLIHICTFLFQNLCDLCL